MPLPEATSEPSTSAKRHSLLSLMALYYLPPLLLLWGVLPVGRRFQILVSMTVVVLVYDLWHGISLKELGFRKDTLKASLLFNISVSLLLVIPMLIAFRAGLIRTPSVVGWNLFFPFYLLVSSPSQEFLFRSNFFALMSRNHIGGPVFQIIASAFTYCFLHIFYGDAITLLATFGIGLLWGAIYYRYPNFWGVAFSHALLGATSILVGLI